MTIKKQRLIPASLLGSLVFFALLWSLDFPKPFVDDLFYCGAGLNLASGGDFSNPFLVRHFASHFFFVYPPIHSYVLAGWLKIFGIHALSLTGFQLAMQFIATGAGIFILRRHKAPAWLGWLVPLGATAAFLDSGLRPEPLAAALTMGGFAMVECGVRRGALVFSAFLLIFLGGLTAPRMTLFAGALIVLAGHRLWLIPAKDNRERWKQGGLGLGAALLSGLVFSMMIHFEFKDFLKAFYLHSQRVTGDKTGFGAFLLIHLGFKQLAILLLIAGVSYLAMRSPKVELTRICIALGAIFPIQILSRLSCYGASRWYVLLILFFLIASVWKRIPPSWKMGLQILLCLLLLFLNSEPMTGVYGILSGNIQTGQTERSFPAPVARPVPEHPVLVDCAAARYFYDYQIPSGCIDFLFSAPFPQLSVFEDFRIADTYLIGPENLDFIKSRSDLDIQAMPQWSPFGFAKLSFYKYPRHIFAIAAESCKISGTNATQRQVTVKSRS